MYRVWIVVKWTKENPSTTMATNGGVLGWNCPVHQQLDSSTSWRVSGKKTNASGCVSRSFNKWPKQHIVWTFLFILFFFFFSSFSPFLLYETNVCRCPMNKQQHPFSLEKKTGVHYLCFVKKRDSSCPISTSPDSQSDSYFLYLTFV